MISRRMAAAIVLFGYALSRSTSAADEAPTRLAATAEPVRLVLSGERPIRIDVNVEIDGVPLSRVWDEAFAKLVEFYDENADGMLFKAEASRLPPAYAIRQIAWGQFVAFAGDSPPFDELDADGDGKATVLDASAYYRTNGAGEMTVCVAVSPLSERLTDSLHAKLDINGDRSADPKEWESAAETLRRSDSDGDELIAADELIADATYPGGSGWYALSLSNSDDPRECPIESVPLTASRSEGNIASDVVGSSPTAVDKSPKAVWRVRFAAGDERPALDEMNGGETNVVDVLAYADGAMRFELRADAGRSSEQIESLAKRHDKSFDDSDGNGDGLLDDEELKLPSAAPLAIRLASLDRNRDGRLESAELAAWLDVQRRIAQGHSVIRVLDHGHGLFEFLDVDRDGKLSVRELRSAPKRLAAARAMTNAGVDRACLPRQLRAISSHGLSKSDLATPPHRGPAWFTGMDRNRDGDLSRTEWIGEGDEFARADRDADGLLDAPEAEAYVKSTAAEN